MRYFIQNSIRILFARSKIISGSASRLQSFHFTAAMKNKIPDRWEEYSAIGKVVEGTRFIAFKVPLNQYLSQHLPSAVKRFTPRDLSVAVTDQNLELGLVVDLTNTTRYYNKEEITKKGIEYKKIFTKGHTVPEKAVQDSFFQTVDEFLSLNKDSRRVIGVHCTHGLNRTGYLICRYMIDRMKIDADEAIDAFNRARGHDMERKNYLDDLRGQPSLELEREDEGEDRSRKRPYDPPDGAEGDDSGTSSSPNKSRRTEQRSPRSNFNSDQRPRSAHGRNGFSGYQDHRSSGSHWNRNQYAPHHSGHNDHYPRQYPQRNRGLPPPMYDDQSHQFAFDAEPTSYSFNYRPHPGYYGWQGQPNWSSPSQVPSDYGQFGRRSWDSGNSSQPWKRHK